MSTPFAGPTLRGIQSIRRGGRIMSRGMAKAESVHKSNANPSAVFNQTLQFITSIKLKELEKRRAAYKTHAEVLDEASKITDDLARVKLLLKTVRSWSGPGAIDLSGVVGAELNLSNLDHWILQAQKDPSFSSGVVKDWCQILERHIRHTLLKFDYAKVFCEFLNEWLSSGDSSVSATVTSKSPASGEDPSEPFVIPGRKELFEQRERLSSIIFQPKRIDVAALNAYLTELFSGEEAFRELEALRVAIKNFGERFQRTAITSENVAVAIKDILASDLLTEDSRATLQEFAENSTVLDDVANVLSMRLASLEDWSWPPTGIMVEMRRHLNGKYRAFTDPDILDAIFLHYIGISWQVEFKRRFRCLLSGPAWKRLTSPISHIEAERRIRFFRESDDGESIDETRMECAERFFLAQLAESADSNRAYDDLLDTNADGDNEYSPAALKKKLLHLILTESHLNKTIYGTHAILRSDLEWFGPSLSHDLILTTFSFFGMSGQWLRFFKTFLCAPLRFKGDSTGELRTRQCGTPISYSLSALCGEAILFCMDFAVNQKTNGLFLCRMHDDFWIWSSQAGRVATAWSEMNRFASLAGLTFNSSKTGSVCVGGTPDCDLPLGDVRWGFLKFEADKGRFVIDQEEVDRDITELRRQLTATNSILGWVNVHNKYMDYFVRSFGGRAAGCFGREHIDSMIDTFGRIQRELFPGSEGGVIGQLRSMIAARFDVSDLPQGCFYFPIESGGLEVRNPLIELLSVRDTVPSDPGEVFKHQMEKDASLYRTLNEEWNGSYTDHGGSVATPDEAFPTFEEYISRRETKFNRWKIAYEMLLEEHLPFDVCQPPAIQAALQTGGSRLKGWKSMDCYQKWSVSLYGRDLVEKFGSLEIVDPTLIPIGMVQLFRSSRMKLDQ